MNDLLYFEWVEIEIHTMPDKVSEDFIAEGNSITDQLVLNPEHEMIQLEYPVHLKAVKGIEEHKGAYYVLQYREQETGSVKFLDLTALHAYILSKIFESGEAISSFKGEIARIASVESEKILDDYLEEFVRSLLQRGLILGYRKNK